ASTSRSYSRRVHFRVSAEDSPITPSVSEVESLNREYRYRLGGSMNRAGQLLDDLPCRAREGRARPGLELLADLLHPGVELRLVDEGLAVGVHHHTAVDDHRVHAAAVGVVNEVVYRVENACALRALRVEKDEVARLP